MDLEDTMTEADFSRLPHAADCARPAKGGGDIDDSLASRLFKLLQRNGARPQSSDGGRPTSAKRRAEEAAPPGSRSARPDDEHGGTAHASAEDVEPAAPFEMDAWEPSLLRKLLGVDNSHD